MSANETVIRPGASVDATDGRLGTVDEVLVRPETGELATLIVRRGWNDRRLHVDAAQVARVAGDTVHLRTTREEAERLAAAVLEGDAGTDAVLRADGQQLRVPILEERLSAETRPVSLGELRVHKRVELTEETVRQAVTRDDLEIERVPMNRPLEAPVTQRTDGDWLVLPVMEEVLVVRKQLMLKEEVRIRRRQVTGEQEVRETVRHERLDLEDATRHGVRGLPPVGSPGRAEPA
jgi:uncharacterized protein (TIGR02271 family)